MYAKPWTAHEAAGGHRRGCSWGGVRRKGGAGAGEAPLLGMNLLFRAVLLLVLRTPFRRALVN
jgi:hypothetical protein